MPKVLQVSDELHWRVKVFSASRQKRIQDVVEEAMTEWLNGRDALTTQATQATRADRAEFHGDLQSSGADIDLEAMMKDGAK